MFLLGIALLVGLCVWGLWQKALTEYTKNYLFDLRDDLRAWFIENGHGLDHPTYRAAREMLNANLWHVGRASYWQYLLFKVSAKKHPERVEERRESLNRQLFSPDEKVNDYVQWVIDRASVAISSYITLKSFLVLVVSAVVGICSGILGAMTEAGKRLKPVFNDFMSPVPSLLKSSLLCLMLFAFPMKSSGPVSGNTMTAWSLNARMTAEQTLNMGSGGFRRPAH